MRRAVLAAVFASAITIFLALPAAVLGQAEESGRRPGDWWWDGDGSGTLTAGDVGLVGGATGRRLTAGVAGSSLVGLDASFAFLDEDADGVFDRNEPAFLDADGDALLSVRDVAFGPLSGGGWGGAFVAEGDALLASPLVPMQAGFEDADGDRRFEAGESFALTSVGGAVLLLQSGTISVRVWVGSGPAFVPLEGSPAVLPFRHDLAVASLRAARLDDGTRGLAVEVVNLAEQAAVATPLSATLQGTDARAMVPSVAGGDSITLLLPWPDGVDSIAAAVELRPAIPDLDPANDRRRGPVQAVAGTTPPAPPPPRPTVTVTVPADTDAAPVAVLPVVGGAAGAAAVAAALPAGLKAVRRLVRKDDGGERPTGPCEAGSLRAKPIPPKGKPQRRRFTTVTTRHGRGQGTRWDAKSDVVVQCNALLRLRRRGDVPPEQVRRAASVLWRAAAAEAAGGPLRIMAHVRGGRVKAGVTLMRCAPDGDGWKWQRLRQWTPSVRDEADLVLLDAPATDAAGLPDALGEALVAEGLTRALAAAAKPVGRLTFKA